MIILANYLAKCLHFLFHSQPFHVAEIYGKTLNLDDQSCSFILTFPFVYFVLAI